MAEELAVIKLANLSEYQAACKRWRRDVRLALYFEYHNHDINEVSDNQVYDLIFNIRRVPPPPLRVDGERTGLARTSIFTECEGGHDCYYEPTGKLITSTDPSAKSRRIRIFRYLPELDPRVFYRTRSRRADWDGLDDL